VGRSEGCEAIDAAAEVDAQGVIIAFGVVMAVVEMTAAHKDAVSAV
jgi:hypothetical protein